MNLAQIVQSHALSFFHLSAPDLLLGLDSDPARRNVFGLIAAEPELARGGIRLRQFGQEIIERAGRQEDPPGLVGPGRRAVVPDRGGPRPHPRPAPRGAGDHPGRHRAVQGAARRLRGGGPRPSATSPRCSWPWWGPTASGSTTTARSASSTARARSSPTGSTPRGIDEYIGEAVEPDSYLKSPYYRPLGYPDGIYRVGPLARLNVCTRIGHAAGRRGAGGVPRPRRGGGHARRSSTTTPG